MTYAFSAEGFKKPHYFLLQSTGDDSLQKLNLDLSKKISKSDKQHYMTGRKQEKRNATSASNTYSAEMQSDKSILG